MTNILYVAMKGFIVKDGKVLLLRESSQYKDKSEDFAAKYDFPGGRILPGEERFAGFLREVEEETGLDVAIGHLLSISDVFPVVRGEKRHIIQMTYLCKSLSEAISLSQDHSEYMWIDPRDYEQYPLLHTHAATFRAFLNGERE